MASQPVFSIVKFETSRKAFDTIDLIIVKQAEDCLSNKNFSRSLKLVSYPTVTELTH